VWVDSIFRSPSPKALFAALDFDLFTDMDRGADSLTRPAREAGVSENRLISLLAALKSLGLIAERDGRFVSAMATARFLVEGRGTIRVSTQVR
jgi:2-hydroxy-4-(methylsulfanyl)butanoate S-methyltransferase